MNMKQMKIKYPPLIKEAIDNKKYETFFHYNLFSDRSYDNVISDTKISSENRIQMVKHLLKYNQTLQCSSKTIDNIRLLENENTYAVVAGQQAGFLLGPLYTLHKIISLLSYAKQVANQTGKKIVPIFWIAGEDHDFEEVNHLYFLNNKQITKWTHPQKVVIKKPLTHIEFAKEHKIALKEVFQFIEETEHTNELFEFIEKQYDQSKGWTDFFARLVLQLFKDEGLIVMDAQNEELRSIEKSNFELLIEKTEAIQDSLKNTQEMISSKGFPIHITSDEACAHIFYINELGRQLLYYDRTQKVYYTKNGSVKMSKAELLNELNEHPELFSNNVVTRPIMQQLVLPAVAFVAGPGEFCYWAELKGVFETLKMKIPLVLLRHSFTYIERNIDSKLQKMDVDHEQLSLNTVLQKKNEKITIDHFETRKDILKGIEQQILLELSSSLQKANDQYFDGKFAAFSIEKQIKKEMTKQMKKAFGKYEVRMEEEASLYNGVIQSLFPNNSYQERVFNMMYFLNKYGFDWLNMIKDLKLGRNDEHYIILL